MIRTVVPRGVLIIVENLPVPFDRRVWQEARTLASAGYVVSVICPKGRDYAHTFEEIEGIAIYRHALPLEADGARWWQVQTADGVVGWVAAEIGGVATVGL